MRQRATRGRPLCACGVLDSDVLESHSWGMTRMPWLVWGLLAIVSSKREENEREPTSAGTGINACCFNQSQSPKHQSAWDWVGKPWLGGRRGAHVSTRPSSRPWDKPAVVWHACIHGASWPTHTHGPGPRVLAAASRSRNFWRRGRPSFFFSRKCARPSLLTAPPRRH